MLEIVLGLAAFALLCLYDYAKMKKFTKGISLLFFAAVLMLVIATARLTDFSRIFSAGSPWFRQVFFGISLLFYAGMVYALFFALPFSKTYGACSGENDVVNTGVYALCRHPGVPFLILGYIFLWLAAGGTELLIATVTFSLCDIVHVTIQDRFFFPHTLKGYEQYQKITPFLFPTKKSIRAFFQGLKTTQKD